MCWFPREKLLSTLLSLGLMTSIFKLEGSSSQELEDLLFESIFNVAFGELFSFRNCFLFDSGSTELFDELFERSLFVLFFFINKPEVSVTLRVISFGLSSLWLKLLKDVFSVSVAFSNFISGKFFSKSWCFSPDQT